MKLVRSAALALAATSVLSACGDAREIEQPITSGCTACHGFPPQQGAHEAHIVAGTYSAPLACGSCHVVPSEIYPEALEHVDGSALVRFSAMAVQGVTNPRYAGGSCAVYCHGSTSVLGDKTSPAWTSSGGLACSSCHPVSPTSGAHTFHRLQGVECDKCHPGYSLDPPAVDLAIHVNGAFEASPINAGGATFTSWPAECTDCHVH